MIDCSSQLELKRLVDIRLVSVIGNNVDKPNFKDDCNLP